MAKHNWRIMRDAGYWMMIACGILVVAGFTFKGDAFAYRVPGMSLVSTVIFLVGWYHCRKAK